MNDDKDNQALPMLNVNVSVPAEAKKNELIIAEELKAYFGELFGDIRDDRRETEEVLENLKDMVFNGGEANAATKEAMVNVMKIKTDLADKKIKAMDLLMRAYLKEKDTFPRYLAAHQHNEFKIEDNSKRRLLKAIQDKVDNEQSE